MHTLRTRFAKEIVAEFLPPSRPSKKVIIFCGGMPVVPGGKEILSFFSKKGFWIFRPRYRGSWESDGQFLKYSPEQDVLDIIDQLPKGWIDLWHRKRYSVKPSHIYVIAGSFGGPAGILASRDPRITKVFAISPVVDWRAPSKKERLDWMGPYVQRAFGNGYRFSMKDWNKLKTGKFYNPVAHIKEINGKKLFIIHAKGDEIVQPKSVAIFAKNVGAKLVMLPRGGHLSASRTIMNPRRYKLFKKFISLHK